MFFSYCIFVTNALTLSFLTADDASSVSSRRSNKSTSEKPKIYDFYQEHKTSLLQLKELLEALDSTKRYTVDDANNLADEYGRECFNVSYVYEYVLL